MDININLPGEKLVIKLWETITDRGIGSLLKPLQIKREGKALAEAQAEAMKIIAQAEKDVEEIKLGKGIYIEGKFLPHSNSESNTTSHNQSNKIEPYIDPNNLAQLVVSNGIKGAMRKEINVSKAILIAEATLAGDSQKPSEKQVDKDWIYRWRDYAGDVSMEELQSLWGNVLAGEIKAPGKFSLRTLEFLRNLSKEEAGKIQTLGSYVLADAIFKESESYLMSKGISFGFLLDMQELGIVSGVDSTGLSSEFSSTLADEFLVNFKYHGRFLQISHENAQIKLTLPAYAITKLGIQVLSLGKFEQDENFLRVIGEAVKSQGFKVAIGDINTVNGNVTTFINKQFL
ncbi:DUF2806 domain-containing protein [Methylotenera sp.]|uniref:DUF2806 domain-containing protein n=1 Tax=Methylotenera sp. TaxID=2051956 RepID=UPI002ED86861